MKMVLGLGYHVDFVSVLMILDCGPAQTVDESPV